ncbi:MAG TPA: ABC transporter substrate-binding protein, partial [Herpetosiphonaceae bacterium]|nr:ABC transporter substrate-binding protein [Herpetosiphonaceae bacterium]
MLRLGLLLTLLLALLAACGGAATPTNTPASAAQATAAPPTAVPATTIPTAAAEPTAAATAAPATEAPATEAPATVAPTVAATAATTGTAGTAPDLTGTTITLYHFGDLSGPLAGVTAPLVHGVEDSVKAINDSGGIFGATIEVEFRDTASKVEEAVAAYDAFSSASENIPVMITYGSGDAEALTSRFTEDKIVNLAAGLSAQALYGEGSGYTFAGAPLYTDQFGYFLSWLKDNWATVKPAAAGDEIKVAYISWPTAYGQAALSDEVRAHAESLGIEIVVEETYDPTPTADATTAVLNAQAAGANVIYNNTLAFGPAVILNALNANGIRDQFVVGANSWAMDLALYAFVAKPEYAAGLITPFPYLWWTDQTNAGVQYAAKIFADNKRDPKEQNVGYLNTVATV